MKTATISHQHEFDNENYCFICSESTRQGIEIVEKGFEDKPGDVYEWCGSPACKELIFEDYLRALEKHEKQTYESKSQ